MTENEAIKRAIRYFECMKNDAVVVLDSGYGTHPGESDLVYRNIKMYAELAIDALEKIDNIKKIIDCTIICNDANKVKYDEIRKIVEE